MTGEEVLEWRGCEVIDRDGDKVGTLEEIYLDEQTRKPEWAIVKSGLFGRSTFVPLIGAMREDDHVRVRYEKDTIKDAPKVDAEGGLTQDEEEQVYRHYGIDYSREESESGLPGEEDAELPRGEDATPRREGVDPDRASPGQGVAEGAAEGHAGGQGGATEGEADVERSTEGGPGPRVERRATERLRLTRYVVTEHVPVQREEVRVEREPANEGGDAAAPGEEQDR